MLQAAITSRFTRTSCKYDETTNKYTWELFDCASTRVLHTRCSANLSFAPGQIQSRKSHKTQAIGTRPAVAETLKSRRQRTGTRRSNPSLGHRYARVSKHVERSVTKVRPARKKRCRTARGSHAPFDWPRLSCVVTTYTRDRMQGRSNDSIPASWT